MTMLTGVGILSTISLSIMGIFLLVFKAIDRITPKVKNRYLCLASLAVVDIWLTRVAYAQVHGSDEFIRLMSKAHLPDGPAALIAVGLGMLILVGTFCFIMEKASDTALVSDLFSCLFASVIIVALFQYMIDVKILFMGVVNFAWGVLIIFTLFLFLYILTGRTIVAISLGMSICMFISTTNAYVYRFRERLFEPVDFFSASTAANVADSYNFLPVPGKVIRGLIVFAATVTALYCLQQKKKAVAPLKTRAGLLVLCAASSALIFVHAAGLKTYHWHKEGAKFNGFALDYLAKFKEISPAKPDKYSLKLLDDMADKYADNGASASAAAAKDVPDIIVIMDEAFSDLSVNGSFTTSEEVTPFISSIQEDAIKGYVNVSVFGGNTANSEYEFLTGNSLAWLSPNVVPYQQYVRSSTSSMVSYLKSAYDYKCIAMHPYLASGWNRPAAYANLGFDECYFDDSFPGQDLIRDYISDREMFETLIDKYEESKGENLFIMGVTMQNHGAYEYEGDNFEGTITLPEYEGEFPEAEQYLSLIHETDKAVEYLIDYFRNVDDEVVIVFYGDHQPRVSEEFYDTISGGKQETLSEQQKRFTVPFVVWSNYDIDEQTVDCTSLNYLSNYVYDAAGIPLPPYNRFLEEMQEKIPSINANGYYSAEDGCYKEISAAVGEEKELLDLYEIMQYNNIFDKGHHNDKLFPRPNIQ